MAGPIRQPAPGGGRPRSPGPPCRDAGHHRHEFPGPGHPATPAAPARGAGGQGDPRRGGKMSTGNDKLHVRVTPAAPAAAPSNGLPEDTRRPLSPPPDPPQQRVVEIFGALAAVLPYDQPVYRRTITTQPVTFTCIRCGRTVV